MDFAAVYWWYAVPAVVLIGLSKGGFAGVGMLATPLLSLAIPPALAAGILLPILIFQDAISVWAFRRSWNRDVVKLMVPSALVGIVLGFVFASRVSTALVSFAVGAVSLTFAAFQLRAQLRGADVAKGVAPFGRGVGALCGVATGFTSHISHAGVPPFQIYATRLGLSRDEFIGTSAITFAAVNWMKVPAYVALGQFTRATLVAALVLLPIAVVATLAGIWLVRRVNGKVFYTIVYVLMALVGVRLMVGAVV